MPTIKGPIKIGATGESVLDFIDKEGISVKLPFTATGWKSDYNEHLITKSPLKKKLKSIADELEEKADAILEKPRKKKRSYKNKLFKRK